MTGIDRAIIESLRDALAGHADPSKAPGQQAYMKSAMPYLGITAPVLRAAIKPVLAEHRIADRPRWQLTIRTLWDEARFREERYAAIAVLFHRWYREWATDVRTVSLIRYLIETGAWWDYVDELASNGIGPILLAHPDTEKARMRDWAVDPDLWVRRSAILSQLTFGRDTDRRLLVDCIEPNLADRDFFIRKAIGWALRQYARTDPDWVRDIVQNWDGELSGLSRREAMKHLAPPEST